MTRNTAAIIAVSSCDIKQSEATNTKFHDESKR